MSTDSQIRADHPQLFDRAALQSLGAIDKKASIIEIRETASLASSSSESGDEEANLQEVMTRGTKEPASRAKSTRSTPTQAGYVGAIQELRADLSRLAQEPDL